MTRPHDNPAEHPATLAWRAVSPRGPVPTSVEDVKKPKGKRQVYRLNGAGPDASAVIAKRCLAATGAVERTLYERILPRVPVTTPRYHGCFEESDEFWWIFLEDLGAQRFTHDDPAHRNLAARWIGTLHVTAADLEPATLLPPHGPARYLAHLRSARRTIIENGGNPALRNEDKQVLDTAATLLTEIEAAWPAIEQYCERVPATLVHGDFRRKNVHVRADRARPALFPIDWETCGWGVPAPDLAPARGLGGQPQIDLDVYAGIVRRRWPQIDRRMVGELVIVGKFLRRLAAMDWASTYLELEWPEKPVSTLRAYQPELSEALAAAPWR